MAHLLEIATLYHGYQVAGGFFSARLKAFRDYLDFGAVRRVFDIGCGPGHISRHIPAHVEYIGFDADARYIDYANRRFGRRGRFFARQFDATATDDFGRPDLILLNGVLHHMDDGAVRAVARDAARALNPGGVFFTLDGCFAPDAHPIATYLLERDRGRHVREAAAYRDLIAPEFEAVAMHVRADLSWVPYHFAILHARP